MKSSFRLAAASSICLLFASCDSANPTSGGRVQTTEEAIESTRLDLQRASDGTRKANAEIARLRQVLQPYRTRKALDDVRQKAKGRFLGRLKLNNGTVLQNAVIREINDSGILFAHSAGVGKVRFIDLPADLQREFAPAPNPESR